MFSNPIFIFYLDKQQHPVRVEKLLNVLVHTHVSVGVFARTPFPLFLLVDSTNFEPGLIVRAQR
jgi:hypothetical protein